MHVQKRFSIVICFLLLLSASQMRGLFWPLGCFFAVGYEWAKLLDTYLDDCELTALLKKRTSLKEQLYEGSQPEAWL